MLLPYTKTLLNHILVSVSDNILEVIAKCLKYTYLLFTAAGLWSATVLWNTNVKCYAKKNMYFVQWLQPSTRQCIVVGGTSALPSWSDVFPFGRLYFRIQMYNILYQKTLFYSITEIYMRTLLSFSPIWPLVAHCKSGHTKWRNDYPILIHVSLRYYYVMTLEEGR